MTDRYAVIGNPVEHSLSPAIHAEFARATGQDVAYGKILAPLDGFETAASEFFKDGGKGLNITLPFKRAAWDFVNSHAGHALDAEAVNTIKSEASRLVGHNTDGPGLVADLERNLRFPIQGKRVLLMGAGGATWGVVHPILDRKPARIVVANRTLEKANELIAHFQKDAHDVGGLSAKPYDQLAGSQFDIVINATSAGLKNEMPPLPAEVFAPGALAYDMVYGKETPFLKFAASHGARPADGLGMLVEQAAESFFIWRGVRPETKPVIDLLRREGGGRRAEG
jgi:shikimate dehydrogenase